MMGDREMCSGTIGGVCCSVESCQYHVRGNGCTAAHIDVKGEQASNQAQTFCGTYRPLDKGGCCT